MAKSAPISKTDRIYLTGFMGCGKSPIGRILAKLLKRRFVDLGDVIVREAGMAIPEIFRSEGEDAFRRLEARVAARHTAGRWVVALEGGTLVNAETRDVLISQGIVVFLKTKPGTLADRLRDHGGGRPLLSGDEPLTKRITTLLEARAPVY